MSSDPSKHYLSQPLAAIRRRRRVRNILRLVAASASAALIATLAVRGLAYLGVTTPLRETIVALAGAAGLGALALWLRKNRRARASDAMLVDRGTGFEQAYVTALENEPADPVTSALHRHVADSASKIAPHRLVPLVTPIVAIGLLAVPALIALLPQPVPVPVVADRASELQRPIPVEPPPAPMASLTEEEFNSLLDTVAKSMQERAKEAPELKTADATEEEISAPRPFRDDLASADGDAEDATEPGESKLGDNGPDEYRPADPERERERMTGEIGTRESINAGQGKSPDIPGGTFEAESQPLGDDEGAEDAQPDPSSENTGAAGGNRSPGEPPTDDLVSTGSRSVGGATESQQGESDAAGLGTSDLTKGDADSLIVSEYEGLEVAAEVQDGNRIRIEITPEARETRTTGRMGNSARGGQGSSLPLKSGIVPGHHQAVVARYFEPVAP